MAELEVLEVTQPLPMSEEQKLVFWLTQEHLESIQKKLISERIFLRTLENQTDEEAQSLCQALQFTQLETLKYIPAIRKRRAIIHNTKILFPTSNPPSHVDYNSDEEEISKGPRIKQTKKHKLSKNRSIFLKHN